MDEIRLIEVKEDIRSDNEALANELRAELKAEKTFLINLMSSPGAGKTTTILKTVAELKESLSVSVIEADIDSTVDAKKMVESGIEAIQLRTGGFCHLDVTMVKKGLERIDLTAYDLVIIENVGNLVCPAEFDTGATMNVMILSVPEGDDKPLKYPLMFTVSDVLLINKTDYLGLSDFNLALVKERVKNLNPNIEIFEISAKSGAGVKKWAAWLQKQIENWAT